MGEEGVEAANGSPIISSNEHVGLDSRDGYVHPNILVTMHYGSCQSPLKWPSDFRGNQVDNCHIYLPNVSK